MCGSPYHNLARWLVEQLRPIKEDIAVQTVKDSFSLAHQLEEINVQNRTMCSMDVQSLFTNVPLRETVDFLCDYIVNKKLKTIVPIELLKPLLLLCTENVLFTFRGERFQQVDGGGLVTVHWDRFSSTFFMSKVRGNLQAWNLGFTFYKRYVNNTSIII